jgi:bifunctional non-homologous end joining protein LigD
MLCTLVERAPEGAGWVHEVKLDGYRMQAIVAGGQVRLMTRGGNDWTRRFPETAAALAALTDAVLDGELVAADEKGMPDFPALQSAALRRATARLLFYAFDLIAQGGEDLRDRPLLERKAALKKLLKNPPERVIYVEHFDIPGAAVLSSACAMGLEGIVSKRADSPYRSGARTGEWVKVKCRQCEEFVVGGYSVGVKRHMSLVLGAWRDGRLVHLGSVGSGISEAVERDLMARLVPLHRGTSPFGMTPVPGRRAIVWVEPRLVAAVDYAGWTADGRLRQPSFKGVVREDEPAAASRASRRR